jgi:hypothetical protein
MVLIIYDVATLQPRRRVERLLRGASFVFLFGNVRWTRQPGDRGALLRRLRSTLRGEAFRIVILDVPDRSIDAACWLHGSPPKEVK